MLRAFASLGESAVEFCQMFNAERQAMTPRFEDAVPLVYPAPNVDGEGVVEPVNPDANKLVAVPRPLSDGDWES
jgi:hypothetical protein